MCPLSLLACSSSDATSVDDAAPPTGSDADADRDAEVVDASADADVREVDSAADDGGTGDGKDALGGDVGDSGSIDCGPLPPHIVRARHHLDSWGVNYGPSASDDLAVAADRLNQLGVRRLRAELAYEAVTTWRELQGFMDSKGFTKPRLRFNDLVSAYNNSPAVTWDGQKASIVEAAASGLLTSLEGPNEMNNRFTGDGTHGVNDLTDRTGSWAGKDGNVSNWATAIHSWKSGLTGGDAAAMAAVEVLAPTIASGLHSDFASLPDVSDRVDFGNVHFYAGSGLQPNVGFGVDNPDVGYFANLYAWCQAGMTPTKPLVITEYGATTPPGEGYSLHAQAAYVLNQMHDAAGIGARRFYVYTLFDPSTGTGGTEGNFGIFHTDRTDKPVSIALGNLKHLFSLNNDYDDPANRGDAVCFHPGYDAAGLRVLGIGESGHSSRVADAVVYPKSDGTTVVSVTNEPTLSDGKGGDLTPAVVVATVHFGSTQSWHRYDVLGASPRVPVAAGTGESVDVPLMGYPQYLILDAPAGYHP